MPDEKSLKDVTVWSGHREMSLEDVAVIQPGLGRLMPEIGTRTWKLYYAAKAANWPLAKFQLKEIRGLMELAAFTRPKYEENLNQFLAEKWKPLEDALAREDFRAFDTLFHEAIEAANVTIKLGMRTIATSMPLMRPTMAPERRAIIIAGTAGMPARSTSTPIMVAPSVPTAATDKSISPMIRTRETPRASIPMVAICNTRFERLRGTRKRPLVIKPK